jgi:magnesium chelatase family protein
MFVLSRRARTPNRTLRRDRLAARAQQCCVCGAVLEDLPRPDASGMTLLREAADAMRLSARGYHRVLRLAFADLDGVDKVRRVHLAEALSYRAFDDEVRRAA